MRLRHSWFFPYKRRIEEATGWKTVQNRGCDEILVLKVTHGQSFIRNKHKREAAGITKVKIAHVYQA